MLHRNIESGQYTMNDDSMRHAMAYALMVLVVILPFIINMWAKRHRPLTRHKVTDYGYGTKQPLNRRERLLARLRLI